MLNFLLRPWMENFSKTFTPQFTLHQVYTQTDLHDSPHKTHLHQPLTETTHWILVFPFPLHILHSRWQPESYSVLLPELQRLHLTSLSWRDDSQKNVFRVLWEEIDSWILHRRHLLERRFRSIGLWMWDGRNGIEWLFGCLGVYSIVE